MLSLRYPMEVNLVGDAAETLKALQQRIRLAAPPDGHQQCVGHELRRHRCTHRPAHHSTRKQVDHRCHKEPTLGRPEIGEVGDPLLVRTLGGELPVQQVRPARSRSVDRRYPSASAAVAAAPARPAGASAARSGAGRSHKRCGSFYRVRSTAYRVMSEYNLILFRELRATAKGSWLSAPEEGSSIEPLGPKFTTGYWKYSRSYYKPCDRC
jgi:hypothetical protein